MVVVVESNPGCKDKGKVYVTLLVVCLSVKVAVVNSLFTWDLRSRSFGYQRRNEIERGRERSASVQEQG